MKKSIFNNDKTTFKRKELLLYSVILLIALIVILK